MSTTEPQHERVSFSIGRTNPAQPVYGQDVKLAWDDVKFELPAAEEPNVRAFFVQVAQAAGRAL